jgi:hypothetical protein
MNRVHEQCHFSIQPRECGLLHSRESATPYSLQEDNRNTNHFTNVLP